MKSAPLLPLLLLCAVVTAINPAFIGGIVLAMRLVVCVRRF
jgi:hypothetical protein